jgi:pyruvate formate lyase activating enzyme
LKYTDLVLYDIKHMDAARHKEFTAVSNKLILDNAKRIRKELKLPMLARLPIIPGYNDSSENLNAAAQFIVDELGNEVKVHLLPYHRLGESKYERMEKSGGCARIEPPGEERMEALKKMFESFGLTVTIGG